MHKIKLISRAGFDGKTAVEAPPTFRAAHGWVEAELAGPAGVFPAGLWGQVPAGDPYVVHACVLTTQPIDAQTFVEVRSAEPVQVRTHFTPAAGNTRLSLVRPSDTLCVFTPPQNLVALELLVESIGGTNELGSRLHEWSEAEARAQRAAVRVAHFGANATISPWEGTLHVIYDGADAGALTLPPRASVPLDAVLTLTRRAVGLPSLIPAGGDSLAGGLNSLTVHRSAIVLNNSDQWTWSGA